MCLISCLEEDYSVEGRHEHVLEHVWLVRRLKKKKMLQHLSERMCPPVSPIRRLEHVCLSMCLDCMLA